MESVTMDVRFEERTMADPLLGASVSYSPPDVITQTIPWEFSDEAEEPTPLQEEMQQHEVNLPLHMMKLKKPAHLHALMHRCLRNMKTDHDLQGSGDRGPTPLR